MNHHIHIMKSYESPKNLSFLHNSSHFLQLNPILISSFHVFHVGSVERRVAGKAMLRRARLDLASLRALGQRSAKCFFFGENQKGYWMGYMLWWYYIPMLWWYHISLCYDDIILWWYHLMMIYYDVGYSHIMENNISWYVMMIALMYNVYWCMSYM